MSLENEKSNSLSQPNFQILHDYLTKHSTTLQDELDDDEIPLRILRMDQAAKQQAAFMIQPDVDSEDEETRIVQADAYQNHLDIIIIQEFFKQLNRFAIRNEIEAKKSLNWLKKRMGLQRNHELRYIVPLGRNKSYEGSCESEDYDEDETFHIRKKRRMTRNMARDTRIKKREERQSAREGWGLQVLRAAVEDLQLDSKPYPMEKNTINFESNHHNSPLDGSKRSQFITLNDHVKQTSLTLVGKVRASKWLTYRKRDKRIPDHFTDIKVSSIIVGNKIFDDDMKDLAMHNTLFKRQNQSFDISRENHDLQGDFHEIVPDIKRYFGQGVPPPSIPNNLKNHEPITPSPQSPNQFETFTIVNNSHSTNSMLRKHPSHSARQNRNVFLKGGDDTLLTNQKILSQWTRTSRLLSEKQLYRKIVPVSGKRKDYAASCLRLIRFLNNGARSFARYEFFYSDIDRPWFLHNFFSDELKQRGIPMDARFTRREWSVIRKTLFSRPRRFSPQFIKLEMQKLEEFRSFVRNTRIPIKTGTRVTAYNSNLKLLHRGVIRDFNADNVSYIVEFERKELGCCFVPDYEVATIKESEVNSTHDGQSLVHRLQEQKQSVVNEDTNGIIHKSFASLVPDPESPFLPLIHSESDEDLEHEIVTSLLVSIKSCLDRKHLLLDAIDELNKAAFDECDTVQHNYFKDTFDWLMGHLTSTSKSLESLQKDLHVMYSNLFMNQTSMVPPLILKPQERRHLESEFNEPAFAQSEFLIHWISSLICQAGNSGLDTSSLISSLSPGRSSHHEIIQDRVVSARKLVLCIEALRNYEKPITSSGHMARAMEGLLEAMIEDLTPTNFEKEIDYNTDERHVAMRELRDALSCFQSEMVALHHSKSSMDEHTIIKYRDTKLQS